MKALIRSFLYLEDREEQIRAHGYDPAIWHVVDDLLCRGVKVRLVDPTSDVPAEIMGGRCGDE